LGLPADCFDRQNAVHVRHLEVHQGDVRPQLAEQRDGFGAGFRFPDQPQVLLQMKDGRHPLAEHGMVVRYQD